MPATTGNGTRSLATNIRNATAQTTPASTAIFPNIDAGGADMVDQIKRSTLAQIATAIGTVLNVTSGIYLPVASVLSNLDAVTPNLNTQYVRIGNIVFVGGTFTADATAASLASFRMTLPVTTANFTATTQAGGNFAGEVTEFGSIQAVSGAQLVVLTYTPVSTALQTLGFNFSYQIQ